MEPLGLPGQAASGSLGGPGVGFLTGGAEDSCLQPLVEPDGPQLHFSRAPRSEGLRSWRWLKAMVRLGLCQWNILIVDFIGTHTHTHALVRPFCFHFS